MLLHCARSVLPAARIQQSLAAVITIEAEDFDGGKQIA
jgi:hypothetical protein